MKIIFLVPWPTDAASTRLRVAQYFPYLRAQGVEPIMRPFMSERFYRFVYRPRMLTRKTLFFAASLARRLGDIARSRQADLVFIHREAFPFGTTLIERSIANLGLPLVLDFDDAIYLPSSSRENGLVGRMKRPQKVADLLRLSKAAVVGNNHLADYARQHNTNVAVVPTPVDTDRFCPSAERTDDGRIVIGWIGSGTTARYLAEIAAPLRRLVAAYPQIEVQVIGGREPSLRGLPFRSMDWSLETESQTLRGWDIGLMPYPDDEWARGKCAHKALLYMSMGIPAVCSPVGMAAELVTDGRTGFLASTPDEWFGKLAQLVESAALRRELGMRGRALVEAQYSLKVLSPRLLDVLTATALGKPIPSSLGHNVFSA